MVPSQASFSTMRVPGALRHFWQITTNELDDISATPSRDQPTFSFQIYHLKVVKKRVHPMEIVGLFFFFVFFLQTYLYK